MAWVAVAIRSLSEQRQFLRDYPAADPVVYFVDGKRVQTQPEFPQVDYTSETVVVLRRGGPNNAIKIDSVIAKSSRASQLAVVYAALIERLGRLHVPGADGPSAILALEGANRDLMFSWRSETIEP